MGAELQTVQPLADREEGNRARFTLPDMKATSFLLAALLASLTFPAGASSLAAQRQGFKAALEIVERGPLAAYRTAASPYAKHPLAPYLEYATLKRQVSHVDPAQIQVFIQRHGDLPVAPLLRRAGMEAAIARQDWSGFRLLYAGSEDPKLRCADLRSRPVAARDAAFWDEAQTLWLSGQSVPDLCDPIFAGLRDTGRITPALRWQRIDLAAEAGNTGLMRYLARELPAAERGLAESHAAFLEAPTQGQIAIWPRDERSRKIAVLGLNRLAKRDPGVAEALLVSIQDQLALEPAQRGAVRNQIALWTAASYLPESARRFAQVPADAYDERLHEWRVREALARGDEAGAAHAIAAMGETQRNELRWRYFAARLAERAGDASASAQFAALAREPSYYGFLAADRIDAPYALCPKDAPQDHALRCKVEKIPAMERAFELHAIGREEWARREWDAAKPSLSDDERRVAVAMADAAGWYDRAVFTLNTGEDLSYYALRFPLPHETHLRREAKKYGLDPAWVAALIRAESAWLADARSHANARGLMQLLPGTAKMEAKKRGIPYPGDAGLYQPRENLTLGIAHLATMLKQHGGQPYLATAAYNAGPTPIARWLAQRPPRDIDVWIETIPYRETREYVSRIASFSAIYDWKLSGKALPVQARLAGKTDVPRRGFACPTEAQATATALKTP